MDKSKLSVCPYLHWFDSETVAFVDIHAESVD